MPNKILIDGNRPVGCFDRGQILPGVSVHGRTRRPLLQKQNVGCNFRSRIRLECCVGKPDRCDEIGAFGQMTADRRVLLVHRVATGDQSQHASGTNLVQGFRQEVIVNGAGERGRASIGGIVNRIIAERNIADHGVEEIVWKRGIFEAFGENG